MASVIYTPKISMARYSRQKKPLSKNEVLFVPKLADLQSPVKTVMRVLHWRRQWQDLVSAFISGATSLQ